MRGLSRLLIASVIASTIGFSIGYANAQEALPSDNGIATYHTAPRYRDSESHPLRVVAYILHPIGWVAREVIFRPFSYFASSTETTRSVFGYREPYDYRQPECFSADDSAPDCRTIVPFNYDSVPPAAKEVTALTSSDKAVYFPDVNFDFNKRSLNALGRAKTKTVAQMLEKQPGLRVVLQGHTDFIGTDEYNQKLGMDRAETVRAELVKLGIAPERLSTVTFGESQPLYTEQEDWARAANRRVEVQAGGEAAAGQ